MLSTRQTPPSTNPDPRGLWLRIQEMGERFHHRKLESVPTAPRHFPEDFPNIRDSADATRWWIPKGSAAEAMFGSAGLEIVSHPEQETWICKPRSTRRKGSSVADLELAAELLPAEGEQPG